MIVENTNSHIGHLVRTRVKEISEDLEVYSTLKYIKPLIGNIGLLSNKVKLLERLTKKLPS